MDRNRVTLIPGRVRSAFLNLVDPVADWLIRWRVQPNTITVASVVVLFGSGIAFSLEFPRIGAFWLLISGILDILDGKVARRGGTSSAFGAFFDSTLDRLGEAALFSGIAIYFVNTSGQRWPILGLGVSLLTIAGSFLVSYTRARAEGLGLECSVGIAQRPERIVGLGVPTLFFGAGPNGWLLLVLMAVVAVVNAITVIQRIAHVYRLTVPASAGVREPGAPPVLADTVPKGK
jgi:CDP-diacylglycerol--glycerol-3-phosphate 3-phosphatidyltransferase